MYLRYFIANSDISYKDTDSLTKLWLSVITNSVFSLNVDNGKEEFNFVENGDLYWIRNNNSRLIKKFHGGTVVILKGGEYQNRYSVGGVYTWAMSREEALANVKGGWLTVYFGVGKGNDGGGKKGKVEILVMNDGYFWNGGTGRPGHISLAPLNGLLLVEHNSKLKFAGLQYYNQRDYDRLSRYLYLDETIVRPEQNMRTLQNTWNLWK